MGIKRFVRYTNTKKGVCLFCGVFPIKKGFSGFDF